MIDRIQCWDLNRGSLAPEQPRYQLCHCPSTFFSPSFSVSFYISIQFQTFSLTLLCSFLIMSCLLSRFLSLVWFSLFPSLINFFRTSFIYIIFSLAPRSFLFNSLTSLFPLVLHLIFSFSVFFLSLSRLSFSCIFWREREIEKEYTLLFIQSPLLHIDCWSLWTNFILTHNVADVHTLALTHPHPHSQTCRHKFHAALIEVYATHGQFHQGNSMDLQKFTQFWAIQITSFLPKLLKSLFGIYRNVTIARWCKIFQGL